MVVLSFKELERFKRQKTRHFYPLLEHTSFNIHTLSFFQIGAILEATVSSIYAL